ncbi:hypothetical protein QYE76_028261 [Lolium multiflorum]|uniref:Uncharacterized protein n=1 Tax=Lolium multiflorum TaxID=4521 RepID=A0AAD8QP62_LOLMU|nr:hypothetical protein QYE76_028261 [Lolium multiflorum]
MPHVEPPLSPSFSSPGHHVPELHLASLAPPSIATVEEEADPGRNTRAQDGDAMPMTSHVARPQTPLDTRRLATLRLAWTPSQRVEHRRVATEIAVRSLPSQRGSFSPSRQTAGWMGWLMPFRRDLPGVRTEHRRTPGKLRPHFARHDTVGEPMAISSHPVLKHHVEHLDFMLHETRKDLEQTRVHAHRAQMALAHHVDAIKLLAKDRRSLRLQRAKKDATITRLHQKIRTLEAVVRTQQDQIEEMEEDGEDIQGGEDFLSDDNDFEEDEFTDEEDYEFLEAEEDGIITIDVDVDVEE